MPTQINQKSHMTYTTISLLAFLVTHATLKQSRAKEAELSLLSKCIQFAILAITLQCKGLTPVHLHIRFIIDVLGSDPTPICLILTPWGYLLGMEKLLTYLPIIKKLWQMCLKNSQNGLLRSGIQSSVASPTLDDFVRFLVWINTNQNHLMEAFGFKAMQGCLNCIAQLLEMYVIEHVVMKKVTSLSTLPVLKGKKGNCRNSCPALRIAWKKRMQSVRFKVNMESRELTKDILPKHVQRLFYTASVVEYLRNLKLHFGPANCTRLQLSMDESQHTEATMVTSVYSPQNDMAAYAPIVVMSKATYNDVDLDELVALAKHSKLTRLAAFMHIKALQQVLLGLGHDLENFRLPDAVLARPLTANEVRYQDPHTGKWMVFNSYTSCATPQIPQNFAWDKMPLLTLCIDQAGTGLSCAQYLMEKMGILMVQQSDKFHRAWNDMKLSFKEWDLRPC